MLRCERKSAKVKFLMMEQEPSSSSRAFMFGQKHQLASWTLESSSNNQNDMFGANGLPLTPSSITMVGNFHSFVKSFNASIPLTPYLTKYLDFVRNKNGMIDDARCY